MYALADCNNFYASCERVFRPSLNTEAIVVLSNNDGCIIARSNEAKSLGIPMGLPLFKAQNALRKHHVHIFSSNYAFYGDMSRRVMNILKTFSPEVELYSIDEAFLDLQDFDLHQLRKLGHQILQTIYQHTGLPISLGIAPTKTLAKVANKIAKKEKSGVHLLENQLQIEDALHQTKVEDIWGIGRQYARFLQKNEITSAFAFSQMPDNWIRKNMGIKGLRMAKELRGESCLPLELVFSPKKGIGSSRSFKEDIADYEKLQSKVAIFTTRCAEKLRLQGSVAGLISVFIRSNSFKKETPQYRNMQIMRLPVATDFTPDLIKYALAGLKIIYKEEFDYKKAGVMLTGIVSKTQIQQNIFVPLDEKHYLKQQNLMQVMDKINQKSGRQTVRFAIQGNEKMNTKQEYLSPCYTTKWEDLLVIQL